LVGISKLAISERELNEAETAYLQFLMGGEVSDQVRQWASFVAENAVFAVFGIITFRSSGAIPKFRDGRNTNATGSADERLLFQLRQQTIDILTWLGKMGDDIGILGININPLTPLKELTTPLRRILGEKTDAVWIKKGKVKTWKWVADPSDEIRKLAGKRSDHELLQDGAFRKLDLEERLIISSMIPMMMATVTNVTKTLKPGQ